MGPGSVAANTLNNVANPIPNSILYTAPPVATTISGLSGSGTVNLSGLAVLTIGNSSTPSSFGGSFGANAATGIGTNLSSITIGGGTTFTLSGSSPSAFVSPITVGNGTLRLTNSSGSATGNAPIFVGDGTGANPTFLGGTGSTTGAVTVNGKGGGTFPGTILGAGVSVGGGTLSLAGGLTMQDGSFASFNLGIAKRHRQSGQCPARHQWPDQ